MAADCLPRESPPALTADESKALHRDLLALRDELAEALVGSRNAAKPVDLDEPIGRISRIDAIAQQKMTLANREALSLRSKQVRAYHRRKA